MNIVNICNVAACTTMDSVLNLILTKKNYFMMSPNKIYWVYFVFITRLVVVVSLDIALGSTFRLVSVDSVLIAHIIEFVVKGLRECLLVGAKNAVINCISV